MLNTYNKDIYVLPWNYTNQWQRGDVMNIAFENVFLLCLSACLSSSQVMNYGTIGIIEMLMSNMYWCSNRSVVYLMTSILQESIFKATLRASFIDIVNNDKFKQYNNYFKSKVID